MPTYPFVTVDVFTDRQFGGNPLAVFPEARGMTDMQMQALANEFNLSETVFVLPPEDSANTARVRIFNRVEEMPFAGHPNVGTGFVLAALKTHPGSVFMFEEPAGLVRIDVSRDTRGEPSVVTIAAPQPLTVGAELPVEVVSSCLGIDASDVITAAHRPVVASVGIGFVLAEVSAAGLASAVPNPERFRETVRRHPLLGGRLAIHVYVRDGNRLRARMFAPLAGTTEDPATGSANAALGALLLSLGTEERRSYVILQGVEMGRPSVLHVTAERAAGSYRASVGGGCRMMLRGEAMLEDGFRHPSSGGHWGLVW